MKVWIYKGDVTAKELAAQAAAAPSRGRGGDRPGRGPAGADRGGDRRRRAPERSEGQGAAAPAETAAAPAATEGGQA
ncbi:hypothetical protein MN0502_25310 [Arthrobacter sp. MN05-02]|nr:hypothetical protein MN0502_25310 [Arthrobacter sp. MN05-02]